MAVSAGRPRRAIEAVERALATAAGTGGTRASPCSRPWSRGARPRSGTRPRPGRRSSAPRPTGTPTIAIHDFELDLARAWTAAAEGDQEAAVGHCRDGADRCRSHGLHAAEVLMRQTAVRLGGPDQLARLTELDRMLDTPRSHLAAAHAAAAGSHDGERLLVIADALEEAGMCLEAADAAAQAVVFVR